MMPMINANVDNPVNILTCNTCKTISYCKLVFHSFEQAEQYKEQAEQCVYHWCEHGQMFMCVWSAEKSHFD